MTLTLEQQQRKEEQERTWLEQWDPELHAVHCSNCRHYVVFGEPPHQPFVRCEQGHTRGTVSVVAWARTLRPKSPYGLKDASTCTDFQSMS